MATRNLTVDTTLTAGFPVNGFFICTPLNPAAGPTTYTIKDGDLDPTESPVLERGTQYLFTMQSQFDSDSAITTLKPWVATVPDVSGDISINELFGQSAYNIGDFNPFPVMEGDAANKLIFPGAPGDSLIIGTDCQVAASPLVGGTAFAVILNMAVPLGATRVSGITGTMTLGTDESVVGVTLPAGTLLGIYVQTSTTQSATGVLAVAARVGGAYHGPAVTVAASAVAGLYTDTTRYTMNSPGVVTLGYTAPLLAVSATIQSVVLFYKPA